MLKFDHFHVFWCMLAASKMFKIVHFRVFWCILGASKMFKIDHFHVFWCILDASKMLKIDYFHVFWRGFFFCHSHFFQFFLSLPVLLSKTVENERNQTFLKHVASSHSNIDDFGLFLLSQFFECF